MLYNIYLSLLIYEDVLLIVDIGGFPAAFVPAVASEKPRVRMIVTL